MLVRMRLILVLLVLVMAPAGSQKFLCEFVQDYHVDVFFDISKKTKNVMDALEDLKGDLAETEVNLVVNRKSFVNYPDEYVSHLRYCSSQGIKLSVPYLVTEDGDIIILGGYETDEYLVKALIFQNIFRRSCDLTAAANELLNQSRRYNLIYETQEGIYDLREVYDYTDAKEWYQFLKLSYLFVVRSESTQKESQKIAEEERRRELRSQGNLDNVDITFKVSGLEFEEGDTLIGSLEMFNQGPSIKTKTRLYFGGNPSCILAKDLTEFEDEIPLHGSKNYAVRYELNKAGTFHLFAEVGNERKILFKKEINVRINGDYETLRRNVERNFSYIKIKLSELESKRYEVKDIRQAVENLEQDLVRSVQLHEDCQLSLAIERLQKISGDLTRYKYKLELVPQIRKPRPVQWIVVFGLNAPKGDRDIAIELAEKLNGSAVSDKDIIPGALEDKNVVLIGGPAVNVYSNTYRDSTNPRFVFLNENWYILTNKTLILDENYGFYSSISFHGSEMYMIAGLSHGGTLKAYNQFLNDKFSPKEKKEIQIEEVKIEEAIELKEEKIEIGKKLPDKTVRWFAIGVYAFLFIFLIYTILRFFRGVKIEWEG